MNPEQVSTTKKRWADSNRISDHAGVKSMAVFKRWTQLRDLGLLKRARDGDAEVINMINDCCHRQCDFYLPGRSEHVKKGQETLREKGSKFNFGAADPKDLSVPITVNDLDACLTFIESVGGFERAGAVTVKLTEIYSKTHALAKKG